MKEAFVSWLATLQQEVADYEAGARPPPPPILLPASSPSARDAGAPLAEERLHALGRVE